MPTKTNLFSLSINPRSTSKNPISNWSFTKIEVREIARKLNLVTAEKKDSQGLCFIGKVSLPEFLQQRLQTKNGDIIEIPDFYKDKPVPKATISQYEKTTYNPSDGETVGKHLGAHFFTIGQRKGLSMWEELLSHFLLLIRI